MRIPGIELEKDELGIVWFRNRFRQDIYIFYQPPNKRGNFYHFRTVPGNGAALRQGQRLLGATTADHRNRVRYASTIRNSLRLADNLCAALDEA